MHTLLDQHPRTTLGFFPTPLTSLPRLSEYLGGPRILMKRDDQSGLALGGNKTRKLEYLLGAALDQECDTLITGGAAQSNHCRQTAAAAAANGLDCHLVLGGEAPATPQGNLLLDQLLGAHIHWSGALRKGEQIPAIAEQLRADGKKPYIVPYGGSSATGALGYVHAAAELKTQLSNREQQISHMLFASSSGGTQAGLIVGAHQAELNCQVIGIRIDKEETSHAYAEQLLTLTNETAALFGIEHRYSPDDITLEARFTGDGYGVVGERERHAINLLARTEGILLDPVYTGRAMGGLLQLIEEGCFEPDDTLLFWHTGGAPALFPNAESLIEPQH
ncbi:D-cysteine desulfhydrase family protein [Sedimenticola sp.]|uniref:D-cysteine desulfhydrase family protein n=1 Tax=Sedimenticola sp. TaxID=1940285 RepID=UPI003D10EED3